MLTYNEMVGKPHHLRNSRLEREGGPIFVFLTPEDFDRANFGNKLMRIGKAIADDTGEGYHCTADADIYNGLVFGRKEK